MVLLLLAPAGALLLVLVVRAVSLRRALAAVPIRIHVGGTRGKTTVCRMIAAGLRTSGVRTLAKTTGTEPMLLLPDGSAKHWQRIGPPTVAEQRRFAVLAQRLGASATVLECMAIRPELVLASERWLVRATVAVLTNVRPDHFEDLPSQESNAASHLGLVPAGGVLVAAEEALSQPLRDRASALGTRIVAVPTGGLPAEAANRALAEAACKAAGCVDPDIPDPPPDAGTFSIAAVRLDGKSFRIANAFACNDVVSLDQLWREHTDATAPAMVLLNHRNDRPLRSLQFLDYFASRPAPPRVLLLGDTAWLRRAARQRGLDASAIASLPWTSGRALLGCVAKAAAEGTTVWGVGNYHGRGAALLQALAAETSRTGPCSH